MTPSSPCLNLSGGLASSLTANKCGLSTPENTLSAPSLQPSQKPLSTSYNADNKDIPDEDTVWTILELAGWRYKDMQFKGQLFQHRLTSPKGYEYMVPVTKNIPVYVEVWLMFKRMNQE